MSLQAALDASRLKATDYDSCAPADATGKRIVCAALVRNGLLVGDPEWITDFPDGFRLQSEGDDPQTPGDQRQHRQASRGRCCTFASGRATTATDVYRLRLPLQVQGADADVQSRTGTRRQETYAKHAHGLGAALSTIRRTAEAAALRFLLSEQMKGNDTPVIVLGDINDGQHSNTANILTEQPRYLVGESEGGGDTALYTAQTLQEYRDTRDVYYTHVHQDIRESLDHILVSEEFYDNSRRRLWMFDGMVVNNDHLNFEDHKPDGTSDHGVIAAAFQYRPIREEAQAIAAAPPA